MKLSLAIIAKDQVEKIEGIYLEYGKYFSEVVVGVDQRLEDFKELEKKYSKLRVLQYEWSDEEKADGMLHFDRKRNWVASQTDCEYYFRLDTDDRIAGAENIEKVVEEAKANNASIIYCFYEYSRDTNGVLNAGHWRETIIKKTDTLAWNKHIHENLVCSDMSSFKMSMEESIRLVHETEEGHAEESAARNIKYLLAEYKKDGKDTDPRTIAYLGRTFLAIGRLNEAKQFLVQHITRSGWDEDRYMSRVQLAEVHKQLGEVEEAKLCCLEAIDERPDYPDAYLKLSEVYFDLQKWEKTIHWGEIGVKTPTPKSMTMVDPSSYTWRPALILAYSYFMLDNYSKANQLFRYVKKVAPNIEFVRSNGAMFEQAEQDHDFTVNFMSMLNYIKQYEPDKVKALFDAIPSSMDDNAYMAVLRNRHLPVKQWDKDSVVIFCPKSLEKWADPAVETGIGGSEEAVIYMARELTKLGKSVTVYNDCGDLEGQYNGVQYLSNHRFNPRDSFDTIISWRMSIFGNPIKARNRWVWYHDVLPTTQTKKSHVANVDKFIVLSDFHKSLLPSFIPEDKIFVSTNGINLGDFESADVVRDPNRIIYASSYDRGIEQLLKMWPDIKKNNPLAELHCYYGWNNIDKLIKEGDYSLKDFKAKMVALFDQPGVFEHGRIGHKELNAEFQKAGIYAYPCGFEEISCITAMKAQANGCAIVSTNYAALRETVKYGIKVNGKMGTPETNHEFRKQLERLLRDKSLQRQMQDEVISHKDSFSWSLVAKSWSDLMDAKESVLFFERLSWLHKQVDKSEKALDIGGNDGHTFPNWPKVTVVDIDLYDIPNFVRADAQELPFEDESYDVAVLAEILEHVPDPIKAIREARRVAKRLVITVPYEHEWAEELLPFHGIDDHARVEGGTREEIARLGNPKCKEFYTADDYQHLYHVRHYTRELLAEHLKLAGITEFTIQKMMDGPWVWWACHAK